MNKLYEKYQDRVAFYTVYIREAHTTDVWQDPDNLEAGILYAKPRSLAERFQIGQTCAARLRIKIPAIVDTFDDAVERAYTGWPDRLYVIDRDGRVAYKSRPGPYGFHPQGVAETLQKLLAGGTP